MQSLTVVIAQADTVAAQQLASNLHAHFRRVVVATSAEEICATVARNRAQVAVVDLDLLSFDCVRKLCNELSHVAVVCTHRVPDDGMWTASVNAGAVDFCHPSDIRTIINAARSLPPGRIASAA